MRLCKVIGSVTASVKHPTYAGRPLMIVQPLDAASTNSQGSTNSQDSTSNQDFREKGPSILAIDTVQAGPGDHVLVLTEGSGVRQILKTEANKSPIRSVIVGIVDAVTVDASALEGEA